MAAVVGFVMDWKRFQRSGGMLIVVSGPSGVGKDAVLAEFGKICPSVQRCVTCTTRLPRENEIDGVDYTFLTIDEFKQGINNDGFLEYAEFCGNYYGTPRRWVEEKLAAGIDVILKIEVQGGNTIKHKMPDAVMAFIVPPSIEELERRLRGRGTDSDEVIAGRLKRALEELQEVPNYDFIIENDSVERAAEELKAVIIAEHCRIRK